MRVMSISVLISITVGSLLYAMEKQAKRGVEAIIVNVNGLGSNIEMGSTAEDAESGRSVTSLAIQPTKDYRKVYIWNAQRFINCLIRPPLKRMF